MNSHHDSVVRVLVVRGVTGLWTLDDRLWSYMELLLPL